MAGLTCIHISFLLYHQIETWGDHLCALYELYAKDQSILHNPKVMYLQKTK